TTTAAQPCSSRTPVSRARARIGFFMVSVFLLREKCLVDEITETVQGQQVHFQNTRTASGRNADLHVIGAQQTGDLSPVSATENNDGHVAGEGGLRSLDEA